MALQNGFLGFLVFYVTGLRFQQIDLPSYITELVEALNYSINKGSGKVVISCNIDDIQLDVSQAIPLGIILNEAVTNALKYAFPGEKMGEIIVSVKATGKEIILQISDNGAGLPDDFTLPGINSLGMTLIKGLTNQLKGTFELIESNGVTVIVVFPFELTTIAETEDRSFRTKL